MTEAVAVTGGGVATVDEIRAHFPALERTHMGEPVAYFDGPGGTQVPRAVVDAMSDYLVRHNANTHWVYPTSEETDALIARARQSLADFVNASADEIAFGLNMTTLTFHLARGLARGWHAGDEVVVTELDHHGNVAPWTALAAERGIVVKTVRMDPATGQLDWTDLVRQIGKRTKLLAIGAASNALGTITDVASAAKLARAHGALVFVDAVHYAPHQLLDVKAMDCDFLACSAYKFYGPHIGVLYGRKHLLESVDFPRLDPAPQTAPEIVETGTQNHEGIVGAAAAVELLASFSGGSVPLGTRESLAQSFTVLHRRGENLLAWLWGGLSAIDGVTVYGPPPGAPRTPTVGFTVRGMSTAAVAADLATRGLFLSHGDFYAATVIERLGLVPDGLVRAGCACYTTPGEVERLVEAVAELSS